MRATLGDGCTFTITPKSVQGAASFTVPLTSEGGDTENAIELDESTVTDESGPIFTVKATSKVWPPVEVRGIVKVVSPCKLLARVSIGSTVNVQLCLLYTSPSPRD